MAQTRKTNRSTQKANKSRVRHLEEFKSEA